MTLIPGTGSYTGPIDGIAQHCSMESCPSCGRFLVFIPAQSGPNEHTCSDHYWCEVCAEVFVEEKS